MLRRWWRDCCASLSPSKRDTLDRPLRPCVSGPRQRSMRVPVLASIAAIGAVALGAPLRAEPPQQNQPLTFGPGDRIVVTVFGQPELSGDVLVDGEGNILLPVVGPVEVNNLTISEAQKRISSKLADGILTQPTVSVRIGELRPVYILGDVRAPGGYQFRPGSVVQTVIALAGGYGLPERARQTAVSDDFAAQERFSQLSLQRLTLIVRLARAEAQRDGDAAFPPPYLKNVVSAANDRMLNELIDAESETFYGQIGILGSQLALLRSQKPRLQGEIDAVSGQIASEKKQREFTRDQANQYGELVKKGLGRSNTQFDLMRSESRHESELWRLNAELSRLQIANGETDIKIHDVELAYKKQILAELQDVRQRLKELDVMLRSARQTREVKFQASATAASNQITITRTRHGVSTLQNVSETMLLEPGDIINVKASTTPSDSSVLTAANNVLGLERPQTRVAGVEVPLRGAATSPIQAGAVQVDQIDRLANELTVRPSSAQVVATPMPTAGSPAQPLPGRAGRTASKK
jgi:polysaccharide biosynthesis/export protein